MSSWSNSWTFAITKSVTCRTLQFSTHWISTMALEIWGSRQWHNRWSFIEACLNGPSFTYYSSQCGHALWPRGLHGVSEAYLNEGIIIFELGSGMSFSAVGYCIPRLEHPGPYLCSSILVLLLKRIVNLHACREDSLAATVNCRHVRIRSFNQSAITHPLRMFQWS